MLTITSRDNPDIKRLGKLLSSRRERDSAGRFVCEGARLCLDGWRSGRVPAELYVTQRALRAEPELSSMAEAAGRAAQIPEELAARVSDTKTPQGVFAVFPRLDNWQTADTIKNGKYVLLDNVRDPGNVGAVLRSCEAFAVDGLILGAGCADLYGPKTLRASMGGVFRLPVRQDADLSETLSALGGRGVRVYAAALGPEALSPARCDFSGGAAVLIGNEASGLPEDLAALCAGTVAIPMAGGAESLNAAVAAGILVWEMTGRGAAFAHTRT